MLFARMFFAAVAAKSTIGMLIDVDLPIGLSIFFHDSGTRWFYAASGFSSAVTKIHYRVIRSGFWDRDRSRTCESDGAA